MDKLFETNELEREFHSFIMEEKNKNIHQDYLIEKEFEDLEVYEEISRQNIQAML